MVARVIVRIRDQRIEAHAAEKLPRIGFRFPRRCGAVFSKNNVGPAISGCRVHRLVRRAVRPADHARTGVAGGRSLPVEAPDQESIFAGHVDDPAFGRH